MTGLFDNETEHLILAGGVAAALLGLVGYAAVHNERHRHEFGFLSDDIKATNLVLADRLPGFTERRREMLDTLLNIRGA